jgi:predicted short-subunit dehydrogenase-like oxidoreductase (DUF2520 family)
MLLRTLLTDWRSIVLFSGFTVGIQLVQSEICEDLQKASAVDAILISVADDAISSIVEQISGTKSCVIHTSGSTSIDVLSAFKKAGVIYPLQTLQKEVLSLEIKIPLFIEWSNPDSEKVIETLARFISDDVHQANSQQRLNLHIAAVFACNFSNHLLHIAEKLCNSSNLSFDLLKPLIVQTFEKAVLQNPSRSQTGPALRKDVGILQKHLAELNNQPELAEIYRLISNQIQAFH